MGQSTVWLAIGTRLQWLCVVGVLRQRWQGPILRAPVCGVLRAAWHRSLGPSAARLPMAVPLCSSFHHATAESIRAVSWASAVQQWGAGSWCTACPTPCPLLSDAALCADATCHSPWLRMYARAPCVCASECAGEEHHGQGSGSRGQQGLCQSLCFCAIQVSGHAKFIIRCKGQSLKPRGLKDKMKANDISVYPTA